MMSGNFWGTITGLAIGIFVIWFDRRAKRRREEKAYQLEKERQKNPAPPSKAAPQPTPGAPITAAAVDAMLKAEWTRDQAEETAKRLEALDKLAVIAARSQDDYLAVTLGILRTLRHWVPGHFAPLYDGPPDTAAAWAAGFDTKPVLQRALKILSWPNDAFRHWVVYDKRQSAKQTGHDFTGINLQGADLSGLDLRMCAFRGVPMDGAHLRGSRVGLSDFGGASLVGADLHAVQADAALFHRARLTGATLANADLRGASLDTIAASLADFSGAILSWAGLTNAALHQAQFPEAKLDGTDLHGTDFTGADLTNADVRQADILSAIFDGATLQRTSFEGGMIMMTDFRGTTLANANLRDAGVAHSDLRGSGLTQAQAAMLFIERDTVQLDAGFTPHPDSPDSATPYFGDAHRAWRETNTGQRS